MSVISNREASIDAPVIHLDTGHPRPALSYWDELDELRERGPIYWNDFGETGFWVVTGYDWCREIYQNPDIFTSDSIITTDPDPQYKWIPTMVNPPEHVNYRHILNPVFSPAAVERVEPLARQRAGAIIEELTTRGWCDIVNEFTGQFPTEIFLSILGLPLEDAPDFVEWVRITFESMHVGAEGQEAMMQANLAIRSYFEAVVAERRAALRDPETDFVSRLLTATIDGAPLSDEEILNICGVLVLAGLDTVKSQLGYAFLHLATHPIDRERLVGEPELWPSAVEEFLRLYAIVANDGRKLSEDVEFHGCPMHKGDMVMVSVGSACRDPHVFDDPQAFVPDRMPNRHLGFAAGPHRCLGSHLARMQLRVGLEEWHQRIPDYRLAADEPGLERGGMLGLFGLRLEWDER